MTYTRHGHHIPGTIDEQSELPSRVARCGGSGICLMCSTEAALHHKAHYTERVNLMETSMDFQLKAQLLVAQYFNRKVEKTDEVMISTDDVYVVWFSKTLQHWKALLSTTVTDGMYYEVTYNGTHRVTYLDAYKKFDNVSVPDDANGGYEIRFP